MPDRVLVAAELRELLEDDPVPGATVEWLSVDDPTPTGDHVAILPLLSRRVGRTELAGLPALRIVANCAVGVDNIDLDAARSRNVVVTNTPDVLTDATADLTMALLLAVARRVKEGQHLLAAGRWAGWHPRQLLGMELRDATLGLVGAGRIGQAVGRRASAFGMRVVYTARSPKPAFESAVGSRYLPLDELLPQCDVVSIHVPADTTTHGMFGAERLGRLKQGALLINTARGELVAEDALMDALTHGPLSGAGLDVFEHEPHVPDFLIHHPRVVVLPHLGSATTRTRTAMARLAARNVRAVLSGEAPLTRVT